MISTPDPAARRLATVTVPAPDLRPEPFLRHMAGGPRGFWAREDRWVAHGGLVAEVVVSDAAHGDRYGRVREAAAAIVRHPILVGTTRAPRARFYGGMSFRSDHRADDVWQDFPPALFHLPRMELEGDASGDAWLRIRELVDPGQEASAAVRLRREAEALRADLASRGLPARAAAARVLGRVSATDRPAWERAVEESLEAIQSGRVAKVVLARTLDVQIEGALDPVDVVAHLWVENRGSHVFLFEPMPGAALVGAAPETVVTLRDGVFHATAVAGSIRRGGSLREQAELAAALLASEKDRAEQRVVRDDVVARLETVAHQIRTDPQPHVLTLARIQHLETEIRASVGAGTGILDLLRLLHPTPAVCGLPRDAALDVLAEEEPFDRGWYAGPVGWFDGDGNGVFAPALRTAVLRDGAWRLFAGAGIVDGSVPALEWEETRIKFTPVLEALRSSGVVLDEPASGMGLDEPSTAGVVGEPVSAVIVDDPATAETSAADRA